MKEFKENMSVEIPAKLENTIENAIDRGVRRKRLKNTSRISAVLAVCLVVISFNLSPGFADTVRKWFSLDHLYQSITDDRGLSRALENGDFIELNEKLYIEDKYVVTLEKFIPDTSRIILYYELDDLKGSLSDKNIDSIHTNVMLGYLNGNDQYPCLNGDSKSHNFYEIDRIEGTNKYKIIEVYLTEGKEWSPEEYHFSLNRISLSGYGEYKELDLGHEKPIFKYIVPKDFRYKERVLADKGEIISLDGVEYENIAFTESPTTTRISIIQTDLNSNQFVGAKKLWLVDERGRKYNLVNEESRIKIKAGDGEILEYRNVEFLFESTYYNNCKKLYLKGEGAYVIDKEKPAVLEVDIENNKVIKSNFGEVSFSKFEDIGENHRYNWGLIINENDKDMFEYLLRSMFIERIRVTANDDSGKEYSGVLTLGYTYKSDTPEDKGAYYLIQMKSYSTLEKPKRLKIEIPRIYTDGIEEFSTRIK